MLVGFAALRGGDMLRHAELGAWILLAAILVGELVPIKLGPGRGEVAPSTTFTFALLLSTGVAAAAIAQAIASAIADLVDGKPLSRSAFNVAQYVIAIAAAGAVLLVTGVLPHGDGFDPDDIPALIAAGVVFFVVNSWLVAGAVALTTATACAIRSPPSSSASRRPRGSSSGWRRSRSSRSTPDRCSSRCSRSR